MKAIELFEKVDGKWRSLSLKSFSGNPIRKEVWQSFEGKEIIGKLTRDDKLTGYVAGTEELRSYYRTKTRLRVWSWEEAAAAMEMNRSSLLDEMESTLGAVLSVFGEGCKVSHVQYDFTT